MPSFGFTCTSSSGNTCFKVFDDDQTTFWTSDWLGVEKDRYDQGFVAWIKIAFNEKFTVSRVDFVHETIKEKGVAECSNFAEVEVAFDDSERGAFSLTSDKSKKWQIIKISPNVQTSSIKMSDVSGKNNVNNFCESAIAEIRIWGCNSDFIQRDTGTFYCYLCNNSSLDIKVSECQHLKKRFVVIKTNTFRFSL